MIIAAALTLGACRKSEPFDNIVRAENPEAFNYVTDAAGRGSGAVFDDAGYYFVFDDDNRTANITISNLRLNEFDESRTLTFSDVPMDFTSDRHETERMVKADVLVATDPVNAGTAITDVTIIYTKSNDLDPNGTGGIFARYTVDGRYTVTAYPYKVFSDGTTRVDNITDGGETIDYHATYALNLDPHNGGEAMLRINGLKLGGNTYNLTIEPLVFHITDAGYTLESTASTTCKGGAVTLKKLSATAGLRSELKIDMPMEAVGKEYRVAAFLTSNLFKMQ